jgi:hypothetical protein
MKGAISARRPSTTALKIRLSVRKDVENGREADRKR